MQVVCNQCHAVCEVDADRFAAPSSALTCDDCHAPLALPSVEIGPEPSWLVLMPHGQAGPYSALQMAQLLDQSDIDWSSLIWRPGLKGWRPARRDPELVTSVAHARGASSYGDTQRVSIRARVPMPATDTIVEPLKRALSQDLFAVAAARALPGDGAEDAFTQVTHRVSADSAEDAFTQVAHRVSAPEPILTDASRSAPSKVAAPRVEPMTPDTQPVVVPVVARASAPASWLPSLQSMSLVAIVAFAFGVLAAALWGRLIGRHEQRAATLVVRPAPVPTAEPVQPSTAPAPGSAASTPALNVQSLAPPPTRELPEDADLRHELHRVSPEVRRCLGDPSTGVEVELNFQGTDGRVGELRLRTPELTPGAVECVTQAVRQMQVTPFARPSYRYWHRFSY